MPSSASRGADGRFLKGASGNPAGRPPGARKALPPRLQRVAEVTAQGIVTTLVERARAGDAKATEVLLRPWMAALVNALRAAV